MYEHLTLIEARHTNSIVIHFVVSPFVLLVCRHLFSFNKFLLDIT